MQKGNKQGTALLEKLCVFLNDDPDVMAACKTFPSKWATVKDWIRTKARAIADEGVEIKANAACRICEISLSMQTKATFCAPSPQTRT